jgi:hypothetical protein
MSRFHFSGASKFLAGVIVGAIVFSGSAIALNNYVSDNTPENGYLLCANLKTKAVTFPNKLSCPSGTKALDMGAVTGVEGPEGQQGPQGFTGPQGPAGPRGLDGTSNSRIQYKLLDEKDIVVDESISTLSKGKKVILGTFSAKDFGVGAYQLEAYLEGNWSDSALNKQPIVKCYFQRKKDYDAAGATSLGSSIYGADETQYNTWNSVILTVNGDDWWSSLTDDPTYLVCVATGSIKGLDGLVKAFPYSQIRASN